MYKVNARKLLEFSTEQLWDSLTGDILLVFEDGEVETNYREVLFSSYIWDYHRKYDKTPLLKAHFIQSHLNGRRLGATTHLSLINSVLWTVYNEYADIVEDKVQFRDDLALMGYEISNIMYNDLTYRLESFVTSLDITDFIQVTQNDKIKDAVDNVVPTQDGIDEVYNTIKAAFKEPTFKLNPLVHALSSGIVNEGQTLQCVGPRGFLTDIDSNIFKTPIKTGFVQGMRSLYDMAIETRSAAKSLIFSTEPLQQSEYFSRRQQIICQNLQNIHHVDCGSTSYLEWTIRDARYEGTTRVSNCDLITLEGKYYLDEQSNSLKVLMKTDTHLIGKTLKLRSPIAGCSHPDPYGICSVCYGANAVAIPANSNLGHIACVSMTAVVGQNILSTKHFDGSSVVEGIVLSPYEKKYLSSTSNGNSYFLAKSLANKDVKLIVPSDNARGIADLNRVDIVEKLSLARVSEFDTVAISITSPKEIEEISLDVSVNGRLSSMTYELLSYIKYKGWSVTEDNNYVIDMNDWDYSKPILILPMRHVNMAQHQNEIAKLLESTAEELEKRSSVINPCSMIVDLHDVVNRRLSINLSILEVILFSSMGVDPLNNDYSFPKTWTTFGIGVKRQLLNKRSFSATLAFEGHRHELTNPENYIHNNRLDHIFDSIVIPEILNQ